MANPFDYRLFDRDVFDIEPYNGTLGYASSTEESDSSSATAIKTTRANSAITEAGDTIVSASNNDILAAFSVTEASDTSSSTAISTNRANSAITEADDSVSTTAISTTRANVSITEDSDTVVSTGEVLALEGLYVIEQDDTVNAKIVTFKPLAPLLTADGIITSEGFGYSFAPGESMLIVAYSNSTSETTLNAEIASFISSVGATSLYGYFDGNFNRVVIARRDFTTGDFISFTPKDYFTYSVYRFKRNESLSFKVQPFDTSVSVPPRLYIEESFFASGNVSLVNVQYRTEPYVSGDAYAFWSGFSASGPFQDAVSTANFSLYKLRHLNFESSSLFTGPSFTGDYTGNVLGDISSTEYDTWVDDGTIRYKDADGTYEGKGVSISIAMLHTEAPTFLYVEQVEGNDELTAANFTSDIVLVEDDDTVSATILGPYQRIVPGSIVVEPTDNRSTINSATKQVGDKLIISFADSTDSSTFYSDIDSYMASSGLEITPTLNRITGIGQDSLGAGSTRHQIYVFEYVNQYYDLPLDTLPYGAVFMVVRNYFVSIGAKYRTGSTLVLGLNYINIINLDWDGIYDGSRLGVAIGASALGNIAIYQFGATYDAADPSDTLSLTTESGNFYEDLRIHNAATFASGVQYTVKSAQNALGISGKEMLLENGWNPIIQGTDKVLGVPYNPEIVGSVSGYLSLIGIYLYLQENVLIQTAFAPIIEEDDTLYASNVVYADVDVTDDDDTLESDSIRIIQGLEQTEQDDIVISYGYHYTPLVGTLSTTFVGYTETDIGDAITFPSGIQDGDFVIAYSPTLASLFEDAWTNWTMIGRGGVMAAGKYSSSLNVPVAVEKTIVFAYRGVDFIDSFPFGAPINLGDINIEGSTVFYDATGSVSVNGIIESTRYFKVFSVATSAGHTSNLLSELGSRVFFNTTISGIDYLFVLDDETNEPLQGLGGDAPPIGIYLQTEAYTETLINDYGLADVTGFNLTLLPLAIITEPSGHAEIVEEDDQLIRGAPIHARLTEDDDVLSVSFAYHYTAPALLGAEFVEAYYVPYDEFSTIVVGENELVVLLMDSVQTTIDNGGFWNEPISLNNWNFEAPNIIYAHSANNPVIIPDDLSSYVNGAYLVRFSNVANVDGLFIDPNSDYDTSSGTGYQLYYYVVNESYSVDPANPSLSANSKAIRINIVDFPDSSLGVIPTDLEYGPVGTENIMTGSLSGGTDRLFSIDKVPVEVTNIFGEPTVQIVTDQDKYSFGPIDGTASYEFFSLLFPPASLYIAGKNPRVEIVEEDDQLIRGAPIHARLTEDDDIVSESFGYHHEKGIITSITRVNVDDVGYSSSFTLSSDDYNTGDLIFIYFTPNENTFGGITSVIADFVTDYPEVLPFNSESYFTGYDYPVFYAILFDGVTKTYILSSSLYINIMAYSGVVDVTPVAPGQNATVTSAFTSEHDNNALYIGSGFFVLSDHVGTPTYEIVKENIKYPTMVYFGTVVDNASGLHPSTVFATLEGSEVLYNESNPSGSYYFTTFLYEQFAPLTVNYALYPDGAFEAYYPPSGSVALTDIASILNYGTLYLIPETVTFVANRAELFEDDDIVSAVVEKSGTNANANVTEADDTSSSAATLTLVASSSITEAADTSVSTASILVKASFVATEQSDFVTSTSSAPVKATFAATDSDDVGSSTSLISIKASVSITEASDTSLSASTIALKASSAITEAADTSAATAGVLVKADLSKQEDNDAIASTALAPVKATFSATDSDDVVSSTSVISIKASATVTEASDTLDSVTSGKTPLYAVIPEADDTGASTANISLAANASITEADDTPSGTSKIPVIGTLVQVEGNDAIASTSSAPVKASFSATDDSDSVASTGTVLIRSSAAITDSDDTSTSATKIQIVSNASITEANDTVASASGVAIKASYSVSEDNDSVASTGTVLIRASATNNENNDSVASASTIALKATGNLSENDDTSVSTSKVAIVSAAAINEQDDYLNSIVLRTITGFTDFVASSDFAAIANRIRYATTNFESAAELYAVGLKTITLAVEMTADSNLETIQTRTRQAFAQFNATFDFNVISIPVPGTTYRIVYVIAEINRVNVDASMNTEEVLGLANEEFILVEKV